MVAPSQDLVVQRVPLSSEELAAAIAGNAGILGGSVNKVTQVWDPETMGEANCHGYTMTGGFVEKHFPDLLAAIDDHGLVSGHEVAIFLEAGDTIGHSGRVTGDGLEHLLKGVGVIESTAARNHRFGYHQRLNSVDDLDQVNYLRGGRNLERTLIARLKRTMDALEQASVQRALDPGEQHDVDTMLDELSEGVNSIENMSIAQIATATNAVITTARRAKALIAKLDAPVANAPGNDAPARDADEEKK